MGPGKYRAKPVDCKFGRSSKGNDQVLANFEISEGEHKGKTLSWFGHLTEKTVDRTLESLEHCGWDGASLKEMKGFGSKEVELVVELEKSEQDGREYLRVRWVNRLGGGGAKLKDELDAAGVASLEERLKGALLARKEKRAADGDGSFEYGANAPKDGPPV